MRCARALRPCSWLLAAALALLLAPARARAGQPIVILLSFDGVRHDYPDLGDFPALARMAREGARAEGLVPVFPSLTFPNHVSLATGTYPDRHGIVANSFFDRKRGLFHYGNDASWIEAEPLWAAAERQGVRSAVYFWVGSESDWHGVGASLRKTPFDAHVKESEKVRQILAWLDLPAGERPRLLLSWWHGADAAGHRHGPASAEALRELAGQDRALAALEAGLDARKLWPDTTLLVVSDHGMTERRAGVALGPALEAAGIRARVVPASTLAHVFLRDPAQASQAVAALSKLDGVHACTADELPAAWRYRTATRTGDVVAWVDPPRTFARPLSLGARVAAALSGGERGAHGYDPALPDMRGILFALGRGAPAGAKLGLVRAIDVAPTVARLLGIEPPRDSEGTPIAALAPPAAGAPAAAAPLR
jgi:predicted AlkP superfamily pyrophosphatase or phosphodiesterase